MKLYFSIDALSPAGDQAWRLQKNDSWRLATYAEPLQDTDAHITDREVAEAWAGRRMQKDKDTVLIPKQKAGMFDFLMRGIYAHAVLHRLSDAPLPDKAQMIQLTESLTPGTAWLIYLNVAGQFTAIDSNNSKIIGNLDIAVRGEIASSPDYIGPDAVANEALMETHYRQFLEGWLEHLTTSNMGIFVPDIEKLNEKEVIITHIRQWQHE